MHLQPGTDVSQSVLLVKRDCQTAAGGESWLGVSTGCRGGLRPPLAAAQLR